MRQIDHNMFKDPAFPFCVIRQEPQTDLGLHSHDFTELVVVTGGRGVHVTQTDQYPISAGDVFLINLKSFHGYSETKDLRIINILFGLEQLQIPMADLRKLAGYHVLFELEPIYRKRHRFESHLRLKPRELTRICRLISTLEAEHSLRHPGFEFMTRALFMQLLGELSRCYTRADMPFSKPLLQIGSVISFIEEHYAEPLRLEALAKVGHMSVSSLLRAFKSATQMSPIEYLLCLRIARASELLRIGEVNITEAAYQVGFMDSNYFTRQFKKITGHAPSQLRRQAKR